MERLSVHLFGGFRADRGMPPQPLHLTRTAQHLFAYLLLHRRRPHPREVLAGTLWGETDDEKGRACLNTALWRLRKVLEPPPVPRGTFLLTTSSGEVGLNPDAPLTLDVAAFEENLRGVSAWSEATPDPWETSRVEKALTLYQGELLAGFYEDWILEERERLHCLYIDALTGLMYAHKHHGNVARSLETALRILKEEPFREDVHLVVMRLYQETGQRFMALRQYEKCRRSLEEELGIPPSEKTRRFYESIRPPRRTSSKPPPPLEPPDDAPLRHALATLKHALETLERVHRDVMEAARTVSRLFEEGHQSPPDGESSALGSSEPSEPF
ncbi:DNA-binding transcriptional activator of the SARP family [Desulfacinum infernum DSM 9756]|uniref:DNA-binding transcriptional activator of the SARP family n=1 Tax=Desulfacinum infernum DSM 9756 TaxID=1121391 RepID=A0A1M5J3G6_9BACT|nr:BTAD domain-containing putative transcriptional regulator [Desulfacinum infernum]SHG35104.1 DNA-binding transcriptional activator of the SARP family [Desulfacinum infernum DSM 9756]